MSDFMSHLVGRALGSDPGLRPRLPSRFETGGRSPTQASISFDEDAPTDDETASPLPLRAADRARAPRIDDAPSADDVPPADAVSTMAPRPPRASTRSATVAAATPGHGAMSAMPPRGTESGSARDADLPAAGVATDVGMSVSPRATHDRSVAPPERPRQPPLAPALDAAQRTPAHAVSTQRARPLPELQPQPLSPAQRLRARVAAEVASEVEAASAARRDTATRDDHRDAPSPSAFAPRPAPVAMPPSTPHATRQALAQAPIDAAETVIQVSIGRIEVRAAPTQSTVPARRRETPGPTALDAYLRERQGGSGA